MSKEKRQKQRVVNRIYGDCFAACMASLLELPLEVLPNDHSPARHLVWSAFLRQFGLALGYQGADGAIWQEYPWIASVKSKNYENGRHSIIMHEANEVLFDPSTKKTYKRGESLLGKDIVVGGYVISVSDFTKLDRLKEYRDMLKGDVTE